MKKLNFVLAILFFINLVFAGRTATSSFYPTLQVFEGKTCSANPNGYAIAIVQGSTPCAFLLDGTTASNEWLAMLKNAVANNKTVSLQYESTDKPSLYLYTNEILSNFYRLRCVQAP